MRDFTKNERIYIILCLDFNNRGKKVRWHDLNDEGLGRSTISRITKKFRALEYIKKNSYDINKKKIPKIRERLRKPIAIELIQHIKLKTHPEFLEIFLFILIIFLFFGFIFGGMGLTGMTTYPTNETNITELNMGDNLPNPSSYQNKEFFGVVKNYHIQKKEKKEINYKFLQFYT